MESSSGFFSGAKFTLYRENQLFPAEKNELESICKAYGLIPNPEAQWPPSPTKTNCMEISVNDNGVNRYPLPGETALLVKHTLRSGQMVNYNGHITVLGNIHPGAKVLAGGNIIVMGTCSGFAHAGQFGNQKAYIMALRIKNTHLRIAEHILSLNQQQIGPFIASIKNNEIVLADYFAK
jgi:septum site-determining protein MinC